MTEMKKCIYCGRSLDMDMIFCPRCGRPVPSDKKDNADETKVFNLLGDKTLSSVPVMRTAHLVDTGMFRVIREEDYPEETEEKLPEAPQESIPEEPAVTVPEDTMEIEMPAEPEETAAAVPEELFPDIPRITDQPLDIEEEETDDLDLSFMGAMELQKLKEERKESKEEVVFPELPVFRNDPAEDTIEAKLPEETAEAQPEDMTEPDLPAFIQTERKEEEEPELRTAEIDVLGDLQSVLKTLIADGEESGEEDVLSGPVSRDTRPSDSSYDVPFVLKHSAVSDEDTKTAMKLAGLFDDVEPIPAVRKDDQETVMYENLFAGKQEKMAVDEGQTVVFRPVRDEEEVPEKPVLPEPEPLPEAPQESIPEEPAEKVSRVEEAAAFSEPPKKKRSTTPLIILILILLAMLGVILYFLFFRGDDGVSPAAAPVQTMTAEPTQEPTPEPTPEATEEPEPTPEETPAAVVPADDPDYFNTVSKGFMQLYRDYLDGTNNGDMSSLNHVSTDLKTVLQGRVTGVNSGYRFKNRTFFVDRTSYQLGTTADGDGYYPISFYAKAENDCTRLSDNVYIDNRPIISVNLRFNPTTGEWYATGFQVTEGVSLDGHELVEITL